MMHKSKVMDLMCHSVIRLEIECSISETIVLLLKVTLKYKLILLISYSRVTYSDHFPSISVFGFVLL